MKAKQLLTLLLACATSMAAWAQLPLPTRVIGGTQFYYHEVQKKESLYSIAAKLKITQDQIVKYNPSAQQGIEAGQYLFFPVADFASQQGAKSKSGAAAAEQPEAEFIHNVAKGETLYGIAKNYGITPEDIIKLNPAAENGIKAGEKLRIPQAAAPAVAPAKPEQQAANEAPVPADTAIVYVTIRPGDTMYGTAKRYNTSVDKLMELNPGISPQNFRSGDVIRVRPNYTSAVVAERETVEIQTYEIQKGDSYYSLSRKFDVPVADLQAANPDMKRLKRGKTMYIPVRKTETVVVDPAEALKDELASNQSPAIQEMYDSVHVFRNDNNVNIALMLPFMLNADKPSQHARLYTEFYKGFLMAVDTLRQHAGGKKINIYAYDTEGSAAHVGQLLEQPEMASMDVIFTPNDAKQIEQIARYGVENKIAVVNAFSLKGDTYNDYSTIFQVNTPQSYMQAKLFDYFDDTFRGYEVLFLSLASDEEKEMVGDLKAHLTTKGVRYQTLDIGTSLQADTLGAMLEQGKRYVIVPASSSRSILIKTIDAIKSVKLERYDVSLCMLGHPEWTTYTSEFKSDFSQIDTYIYSRFFTMHNEASIRQFDERFHHWYGEYMIFAAPRFGLLGYDTGCYFTRLFLNGEDYNHNFDYQGLQNSFDFDRVSNWSGFVNKSVYFIHFTVFNTIETTVR